MATRLSRSRSGRRSVPPIVQWPSSTAPSLTTSVGVVMLATKLANASSFCGRCESVCPMQIPLPKLMRHWRERAHAAKLGPATERFGITVWAFFASRPWAYGLANRVAARLLRWLGRGRGRITRLALAGAWTGTRDLPAPEGRSFQERWRAERGGPPGRPR